MTVKKNQWQIKKSSDCYVVTLQGELCASVAQILKHEMSLLQKMDAKDVIVNCHKIQSMEQVWASDLALLEKNLVESGHKMILTSASEEIKNQLVDEGLSTHLMLLSGGLKTKSTAAPTSSAVAEFIDSFQLATTQVMEIQAGLKFLPGASSSKKTTQPVELISGVISIQSLSVQGFVVFSFPAPTFLHIMSGMLGEELNSITSDLIDGAGELTNMIFGHAKVALNEKGHGLQMALPLVIKGSSCLKLLLNDYSILRTPFKEGQDNFVVGFCLSDQPAMLRAG
jgi:CheY-specific phosphatase CheX/anti-anti-sigma regulatory factor